jgi:glutamyl-Q tRNA(Asp) synthetase
MEDLDAARVIPGSAGQILQTLEHFGLTWDGPVLYQSTRRDAYEDAILALQRAELTFQCSCSRRELPPVEESGYPGTCRQGPARPGPFATRLRVDERLLVLFDDRIQGLCRFDLGALGDFVIRRKDGIPSYQLAVVTMMRPRASRMWFAGPICSPARPGRLPFMGLSGCCHLGMRICPW